MQILDPLKIIENPNTGKGVIEPMTVYHPPSDQYLYIWMSFITSVSAGGRYLYAAVKGDGDVIGTPLNAGNTDTSGADFFTAGFYDPYSEKIFFMRATDGSAPNQVLQYHVFTISGTTVTHQYFEVSVGTGSLVASFDPAACASFGNGYVLVADEGPKVILYSVNQSTGELTYISDEIPTGYTGTDEKSIAMCSIGNDILFLANSDGSTRDDMCASIVQVAAGVLTWGAKHILQADSGAAYETRCKHMGGTRAVALYDTYDATLIYPRQIQTLTITGTSIAVTKTLKKQVPGSTWFWVFDDIAYFAETGHIIHSYYDNSQYELYLLVYDEDLELVGDPFYKVMTEDASDSNLAYRSPTVGYDSANDYYFVASSYEEDSPADVNHLYLGRLGDIIPLFWTNFIGQSERKA